ncbi:hypothetical protein ACWDA9_38250, partial [Streptomyces sp. NPDC001193]
PRPPPSPPTSPSGSPPCRSASAGWPAPPPAGEIVIHGSSILIDGEHFPWLVAAQPMDIGLNPDGVSTVRLTLMAASVQVIRPEPRPESEH